MITNNTKTKVIKYWIIHNNHVEVRSFGPGNYFKVDKTHIYKFGPHAIFYINGSGTLYIFDYLELWDCAKEVGQDVLMPPSSSPSEEDVQTVARLAGSKSTTSTGETTSQDALSGVLELVATAAKLRGVSFVSSASTVINESGLDVELKIRPYPVCATTAIPTRSEYDRYVRASDCVPDELARQYIREVQAKANIAAEPTETKERKAVIK